MHNVSTALRLSSSLKVKMKISHQYKHKYITNIKQRRNKSIYYISTEIYSVKTRRIKISLSLMKSNLIGHTIILTGEKYRMTNQRIRIGFSRLSGRSCEVIESESLQCFLLSQNHGFKVCRHKFSETIYRGPRKRNYKKENSTECREIEFISSFWMFYDHSSLS